MRRSNDHLPGSDFRWRLSRRSAIETLAGGTLAGGTLTGSLATSPLVVAADDAVMNRFPRMIQEFYVDRVRRADRRVHEKVMGLKTREEAIAYVKSAKQRCRRSFGPNPSRTPLNATVTRTLQRDGYRIENVIFESRPGFPVTANLYLPDGHDAPVPGVVGTCGHSSNGKAAEAYQSFAQGLARLGIACLIYDPIGQGERLQYVNDELKSSVGVGVREHLYAGNQQFLVGEFFGNWRAWDGIRALDYLQTRDEVDSLRIGVTGNSGGGTMTTWLAGLDDRWSMAAPSCFVTTFRRNLENELPQDTEQCPPNAFPLGLDHCDFLAAMAPKPVIILAKERDYFDVRGSEESYQRLKHLYGLLDAEDKIALFVGPTGHGYSQENREAMYSWFSRAVGNSADSSDRTFDGVLRTSAEVDFAAEPELVIEQDQTLWCTPQGQVARIDGTRTIFDFTTRKSKGLAQKRGVVSGESLRESLPKVLKLPKQTSSVPDYRNFRFLRARDYPSDHAMAYTVATEPGINAIVYRLTDERWHSRPQQAGGKAILYVSHLSSDRELREEPLIRELRNADPETPFYTCDTRGIGESLPGTSEPGSFHSAYGSDYFYAIHGVMLGRPMIGQRTHDLLQVLRWLESIGHDEVHLAGLQWGALPATFAALLSETVTQVTLKKSLKSYASIAESEHYDWPLSTLIPGVLRNFDLPDCYRELRAKKLRQIEPLGAVLEK